MAEQTQYIEVQSLQKGEVIFRQGDEGSWAYVVERGAVGIYSGYGTQEQKLLKRLEPGSFFGEMGMVRGFPRSADAVAEEANTGVSKIGWDTLGRYFSQSPSRIVAIMQQMAQRISELSDDYLSACGAVRELLEQRDVLAEDNQRISRKMERILNQMPADEDAVSEMERIPAWRSLDNEGKLSESRARYKKFTSAYSSYIRKKH